MQIRQGRLTSPAWSRKDLPIDRVTAAVGETKALIAAVERALSQPAAPAGDALADLPLAVLPAAARHDTMAIVLSGDGGWRDIDRELGEALSQAGVPTVGIDSLRYFWTRKPPETIAADLTRIVDHFTRTWKVQPRGPDRLFVRGQRAPCGLQPTGSGRTERASRWFLCWR